MQGSNRPLRAAGEGWDVQTDVSGDHQRVQSPVRLLPRHPAAPAVHDAGGIPAAGDPAAALRDVSHAPRHGGAAAASPTGGAAGYRRGAGLSGVPCDQRHAASPAAAHTGGFPGLHKLSVSLHSFEGNGRQDAAARIWRVSGEAAQRLSSRASCAPCGCGTAADWTGATERSCPFSRKSWAGT